MAQAGRGSGSGRTRTTAVLAVVVVVVAALVTGVVLGVRWWTHPDLFGDLGARSVAVSRPIDRATLHVAVTFPSVEERDEVQLSFRDVEAHFSSNSARTEAKFWLCSGESSIGVVRGRLEKHCPDARRIERGTRMTYSSAPDSDHVVVTLRPTRPGRSRLHQVDLDYSMGAGGFYRRGTESIDLDVTVRAR